MKATDGRYIRINKAELTHDEPTKLVDIDYLGRGKWRFVICDMDMNFEKTVGRGYEEYSYDRYMAYRKYSKEVDTSELSRLKLDVDAENGFKYEVRMPIPEELKGEITSYAEQDGKRKLPREIVDKLEKAYSADDIFKAIDEQCK